MALVTKTVIRLSLNKILEYENKRTRLPFYKYFIGCLSLVSKEWNSSLVGQLKYKYISITESEELSVILKWFKRGITFDHYYIHGTPLKYDLLFRSNEEVTDSALDILVPLLECANRDHKFTTELDHQSFKVDRELLKKDIKITNAAVRTLLTGNGSYGYDFDDKFSKIQFKDIVSQVLPFHQRLKNKHIYTFQIKSSSIEQENINEIQQVIEFLQEYRIRKLFIGFCIAPRVRLDYLRDVVYQGIDELIQSHYDALLEHCPNLKSIILISPKFNGKLITPILINHPSLTGVKFQFYDPGVTDKLEDLVNYLNNNNKIKKLIWYTVLLDYTELLNSSPSLALNYSIYNSTLETCFVDDINLFDLWKCPSSLVKYSPLKMDQENFNSLLKYHGNLKEIEQVYSTEEQQQNIPLIYKILSLNLPNLVTINLDIKVASFTTKDLLESLVENKYLTSLSLFGLDHQQSKAIVDLNLPNLTKIEFTTCGLEILKSLVENKYLKNVTLFMYCAINGWRYPGVPTSDEGLQAFEEFLFSYSGSPLNFFRIFIGHYTRDFRKILTDEDFRMEESKLEELLMKYYKTHSQPIDPDRLNIHRHSFTNDKIDSFVYLQKRYLCSN